MTATATARDLEAVFLTDAPEQALTWLAAARERVSRNRYELPSVFAGAGRACGRTPLIDGRRTDEIARVLILTWLSWRDPEPLMDLYRWGDADEKHAVLSALEHIELAGAAALPIVEDALRTNDTRLIAAALGRYGAQHLPDPAYRHAILKCVFCDIPLDSVSGLPDRADAELARMLDDFVRERIAAGRSVPEDVWPILARFPSRSR